MNGIPAFLSLMIILTGIVAFTIVVTTFYPFVPQWFAAFLTIAAFIIGLAFAAWCVKQLWIMWDSDGRLD